MRTAYGPPSKMESVRDGPATVPDGRSGWKFKNPEK